MNTEKTNIATRVLVLSAYSLFIMMNIGCSQEDRDALGYALDPGMSVWNTAGFSMHDALIYQKSPISPQLAEQWRAAGFQPPEAIAWRDAGIGPKLAQSFIKNGILNPSEGTSWADGLNSTVDDAGQRDNVAVAETARRLDHFVSSNGYSIRDVCLAYGIVGPSASEDELRTVASKIHSGTPISDVQEKWARYQESLQLIKDKDRFGSDTISSCGGAPKAADLYSVSDPYSLRGKCFVVTIGFFGSPQWLGENSVLVVPNLQYSPPWDINPVIFQGAEHIQLGHTAVVMGVEPMPYTSALGASITPATVRVIKYLTSATSN